MTGAVARPGAFLLGGLIVLGVSGYLFVSVTSRELSVSDARDVVSFYFLTNIVGSGLLYAVEQVANRATSHAAAGDTSGPARGQVARSGVVLALAVTAALLALGPIIVPHTFGGSWAIYACVLATPLTSSLVHLQRGLFGGAQKFRSYAFSLTVEGGVRIAACLALAAGGVTSGWVYCATYVGASALSVVACWPIARQVVFPSSLSTGSAVYSGLVVLAFASLAAQALPNVVPLLVTSGSSMSPSAVLAFSQAALVARLPLLLIAPFQAMVLPRAVAARARHDWVTLRRLVSAILLGTTSLAVLGAASYALVGSQVLDWLFEPVVELPPTALALLATSTALLIAASLLTPVLLANGADLATLVSWAAGTFVAAWATVATGFSSATGAAAALVSGALVAVLLMCARLVAARQQAR